MTTNPVFPDAVQVVADYLRPALAAHGDPVDVVSVVPNPRPDGFVRLLRLGGIRHTVVTDAAQITAECWAATDEEAGDRAQLVRALLLDLVGTVQSGIPVYRVEEVGGPACLPDPESTQSRYVLTVLVHLRGYAA